jgi:hypothetical protein
MCTLTAANDRAFSPYRLKESILYLGGDGGNTINPYSTSIRRKIRGFYFNLSW